ncbi:ATP-binding cassette domain-containing protein [Terribacillus saccharophilus]|uniref:Multidrug ABC transporter ATP-binding protein n=1 Tax=Terribacillus saccharophilus TaxID=361277 RepID=A0A268A7Q1_9BACI|nr:ABC transporter ATP-binding protein [Terribacillus saccharophilus]PAD20153.1 multidrug ABC transporter ATP-binding protein [Terribacillus saccharophilus]
MKRERSNLYVLCENVSKKIKNNIILDNINLSLEQGMVHGFRGYNGSGKTMLLRAIGGLIKPSKGRIVVDNKIIGEDMPFPESVGILIEYPSFIPNYTGYKNLLFLAKINNKVNEDKIKETIRLVGLDPDDKRKYKKYSLGMKQRLGIAQAIMEEPSLLLLDEPTNALDEDGIELMVQIIRRLKSEGKTIIVTSHDRDFLERVTDNTYIISKGMVTNG